MDMTSPSAKSPSSARRWNSISVSVAAVSTRLSSDLVLLPLTPKSHTYSSLKDLLPPLAAVNSPKMKSTPPGSDISIRNRLVKQAARAYLTPMSDFPRSEGGNFFHRLWTGVAALLDLFCRRVVRILNSALRTVRIRSPEFRMYVV